MPEREGRKFFFLIHATLAALFLISGVALAVESAGNGYGLGLVIVMAMSNGGVPFFIMALLFSATAIHLRP